MLHLPTPEAKKYLEEVRAFADSRGPEIRAKLEEKIKYLEEYGGTKEGVLVDPSRFVVVLSSDRSPNSFNVSWYLRKVDHAVPIEKFIDDKTRSAFYNYFMNGGLIYYGPKESGVGGPQFSVRSGSESDEDWTVNT